MRTIALSRKLVAAAAAGLVFGGVGIAAAAVAPSGGSSHSLAVDESTTVATDDSTTTVVPDDSTTTSVDESTSTTVDESTSTTVDESTSTTVDESTTTTSVAPAAPCNHGQQVSDVAHSAPRGHDAGPGAHGKAVSTVAHEKCAGQGDDTSGNDKSEKPGHGKHHDGADQENDD